MPAQMMGDNQSWIKLSQSEKMNAHSKHIDISYHLVCDQREKGVIQVICYAIEEMTAAIPGKPLAKD